MLDLPVRDWLRLDAGVDYEGNRFVQNRSGVARPPTGGASGASVGGFGEQTGSFGGMASGYAADALTVYTNHFAPFVDATLSLLDKRLTVIAAVPVAGAHLRRLPGDARVVHARLRLPRAPAGAALSAVAARRPQGGGRPVLATPLARAAVARCSATRTSSRSAEPSTWPVSTSTSTRRCTSRRRPSRRHRGNLVVPGESPGDPPLVNDGQGRAYGAEILVRQQLPDNFFGWVSYTFSRSERKLHPDLDWHRYQFDQTHILTLMASYQLPRGFQVGARYRYVTGDPYTPIVGRLLRLELGPVRAHQRGAVQRRVSAPSTSSTCASTRSGRSINGDSRVYLDVQNVLRASNPEAIGYNFDYTVPHPVSGLPLLPIIGIRGDF